MDNNIQKQSLLKVLERYLVNKAEEYDPRTVIHSDLENPEAQEKHRLLLERFNITPPKRNLINE